MIENHTNVIYMHPKMYRFFSECRNWGALGNIKADRREGTFKTTENCFQMQHRWSRQILTFFPIVPLPVSPHLHVTNRFRGASGSGHTCFLHTPATCSDYRQPVNQLWSTAWFRPQAPHMPIHVRRKRRRGSTPCSVHVMFNFGKYLSQIYSFFWRKWSHHKIYQNNCIILAKKRLCENYWCGELLHFFM